MNMYELEKRNAARGALEFVKNGMTVGLGTGSTAAEFIRLLTDKIKSGLSVQCVATSVGSQKLAESMSIEVVSLNKVKQINIAIDGADIATKTALLKGGGGALTREKVIDYEAKQFIVIADESKIKNRLEGSVVVEGFTLCYPPVLSKRHNDTPLSLIRP